MSHGYTTPVDVVKTRLQTDAAAYVNCSLPAAVARMVEQEGVSFLLAGFVPTFVGYGLEGALKFGCYEVGKGLFAGLTGSPGSDYLVASVVAGAAASVVLCPTEEVRIRMVANPAYADGPLAALAKIWRSQGPLTSFRGLPPMLAKQVPYTMAKQVSFDLLCRLLYAAAEGLDEDPTRASAVVPIAASIATSFVACAASHPGDVLLSEYYKQECALTPAATLRAILHRSGVRGLLVGLNARFLHVGAIIVVQLSLYDAVKQGLGLAATGKA